MKNLLFVAAICAMFTACTGTAEKVETTNDSIDSTAVIDSTVVDSIVVDSVQ